MKKALLAGAVVVLGGWVYNHHLDRQEALARAAREGPGELPLSRDAQQDDGGLHQVREEPAAVQRYQCDGRERCGQMHSCEEARYFLQNCPNVKMDGDHDGVPCEDQFCGH